MESRRIIILTGVTDDVYRSQRTDNPIVCTSAGKRILLYQAIREATGSSPLLLSPHPRGRGTPADLAALQTHFGECEQRFSKTSGIRKIRFFLDLVHYAKHVYQNTREGDLLIFDNYELIYVLALHYCRIRGRRNPIVLEYEDGKHVIDRGFNRWMSGLAELLGKPLVDAAIVATPSLVARLPEGTPVEIVPGLLNGDVVLNPLPNDGSPMHFIYSGSLDFERGVPLLLDYLESGKMEKNTVFHITGQGHFGERFTRLMEQNPGRIVFHGCVSREELNQIQQSCHFGLNLQVSNNPISQVTYPSKTFDYMNAGLRVISTHAALVDQILGTSAIYLQTETVHGLAVAIEIASQSTNSKERLSETPALKNYSFQGTTHRLRVLFEDVSH